MYIIRLFGEKLIGPLLTCHDKVASIYNNFIGIKKITYFYPLTFAPSSSETSSRLLHYISSTIYYKLNIYISFKIKQNE